MVSKHSRIITILTIFLWFSILKFVSILLSIYCGPYCSWKFLIFCILSSIMAWKVKWWLISSWFNLLLFEKYLRYQSSYYEKYRQFLLSKGSNHGQLPNWYILMSAKHKGSRMLPTPNDSHICTYNVATKLFLVPFKYHKLLCNIKYLLK